MNKIGITAVAFITFLMLAAGFASIPTSSAYSGSVVPFAAASGDNLTIYANGTVSNSSLVTVSGNVYTLTQSINGSLYVNDSGITVSGNGYSVNGYNGIDLYQVSDVTITDFGAETGYNSTYLTANMTDHITLSDSNVSLVSGNAVFLALYLSGSVTFTGNYFSRAYAESYFPANVTVSENTFDGGSFWIYGGNNVAISWNSFVGTLPSFIVNGASRVEYTNNSGFYVAHSGANSELYVNNATSAYIANDNISVGSYSSSYSLFLHHVSSIIIENATYINLGGMSIEWDGTVVMNDLNSYGMTTFSGVRVEYTDSLSITDSYFANSNYNGYYGWFSRALFVLETNTVVITNSGIYGPSPLNLSLIQNLFMNQCNVTAWGSVALYTAGIASGTIMNSNFTSEGSYGYGFDVYLDWYTNVTFTHNIVFDVEDYIGMAVNWVSGARITDNVISSYYGSEFGIFVNGTMNVVIAGNTIQNSYVDIQSYGDSGSVISGNNLTDSEYAVSLQNSFGDVVSGNTVQYVYYAISIYSGTNLVVSGNNVSHVLDNGFEQYYTSGDVFTANTVTTGTGYGYGFRSYQSISYDLAGNTFTGFSQGIHSTGDYNATWINNEFQNGNLGIVMGTDGYITVAGNTFAYYNTSIVMAGVISHIAVYHNNFISYLQALNITNGTSIYNVSFDGGSTVGGNYWSSYTGSFSNGLGTSPYDLGWGLSDNHSLQYQWSDPVITFVSTGLLQNAQWSVSVNGKVYTTTSASINVPINRGSYGSIYYSVGSVVGYSHTVSSGTVYYSGSSVTTFVNYVQLKYGVTFSTSGLPIGDAYTVNIGNSAYVINGSKTISLPNGTYSYSITPPAGYTTHKETGTITVNGASVAVSVPFWTTGITATFSETGLSGGSTWSVVLNGNTYSGNGSTITVTGLQAGTYNFTVSGPNGYTYTSSGSVTLANNNTILVNFIPEKGGVGAGVLTAVIIGSIAAGFVAMLLVALFAPAYVDSLRNRIQNRGNKNSGGKESDSKPESREDAPGESKEGKN